MIISIYMNDILHIEIHFNSATEISIIIIQIMSIG